MTYRLKLIISVFFISIFCTSLTLCGCGSKSSNGNSDSNSHALTVNDTTTNSENRQQSEAAQLTISHETDQIVIVRANEDTSCTVSLHELIDDTWQCTVSSEGVVGMDGVGAASESTMVTPQGAFGLGFAFGNASNPGTQMEYRQVTSTICWVDDPNSQYYNQWVDYSQVSQDWSSAEYLAESPNAYKYGVFIQYNTNPVVPGAGSAFFLHCYSSVGSWGCVQTDEDTMRELLIRLHDGAMIVIDYGDAVLNY